MRFKLKLLFVLTTLVAIVVGYFMMKLRHEKLVEEHLQSFEALASKSSAFDADMRALLCAMPEVAEVLDAYKSPVPENYLAGGSGYTASMGEVYEAPEFEATYDYHWQRPDAWEAGGKINISLTSQLKREDLSPHTLVATFTDTEVSRQVIDWLEEQLDQSVMDFEFVRKALSTSQKKVSITR